MKKTLFILLTISAALLAGCNPNKSVKKMMDRIVPKDDDAFALKYLNAVRSHRINTSLQMIDSSLKQPGIESNLNVIAEILDKGDPITIEIVGCNVHSTPEKRRSNLTYQFQFTNAWVVANVVVDTIDGQKYVVGNTANQIPESLGELNAFTFEDKKMQYYIMLITAVTIPLFILFSLVVCIRTKMKKRKWLWIIFILLGIGKLTINWTTGQFFFNPLSLLLLGSGYYKPGLYAQWTISIAFPLGAILFLLRREKLVKKPEEKEHNQSTHSIANTAGSE